MTGFEFRALAGDFADRLTRVLNATVTDGIRLRAGSGSRPDELEVGYGARRAHFPLRIGRRAPLCHMHVGYALVLDPEREHLAVARSVIEVAADPDGARPVVRFDYERGKIGGYPETHIQITGQSAGLDAVLDRRGRQRPLAKLHFPVGGRRFRPSLEDVIEFLILEGLAEPRPGWQAAVEEARAEFQRRQLRAAVRRDPSTAAQELREVS